MQPYHIHGFAQGTSYSITYYAVDQFITGRQTDSILLRIDSSLSIYKPYSLISRFNKSSSGIKCDVFLETVVKRSITIWQETGGIFDITVKALVGAWGFGSERITQFPGDAQIRSLLTNVGSEKLLLKGHILSKLKPGVQIDVNGIAQGYSVDILAGYFEQRGITNYIIEIGGEIRVKGHKPSGEKMLIGIEGPSNDPGNPYPIKKLVQIDGGAVTTSGTYRHVVESGNKKVSHLIDPRTGYSIQNEMISVTVVAKDGITADGYDNALMGMGLEKAMAFVQKRGDMEIYFIYHKKDGAIADTATAGFYRLLKQP